MIYKYGWTRCSSPNWYYTRQWRSCTGPRSMFLFRSNGLIWSKIWQSRDIRLKSAHNLVIPIWYFFNKISIQINSHYKASFSLVTSFTSFSSAALTRSNGRSLTWVSKFSNYIITDWYPKLHVWKPCWALFLSFD